MDSLIWLTCVMLGVVFMLVAVVTLAVGLLVDYAMKYEEE